MEKTKHFFFFVASFYICLLILGKISPVLIQIFDYGYADASFPDWGVFTLTIIAIIFSAYEYYGHKKREKLSVFSEYSKRYAEDPNIKCVSVFLIEYFENTGTKVAVPTIYQKEMFLRYFEELELLIEKGKMDEDDIADFFVYYAVAAAFCQPFIEGTELESSSDRLYVWRRYRAIVKRYYDRMKEGIVEDYSKHHPSTCSLKLLVKLDKD